MPINIKNREAEALLKELKALTGKGTSKIVLELLRQEAEKLRGDRERDIEARKRRVMEICQQVRAKLKPPIPRSTDDLVGYDEFGLPT